MTEAEIEELIEENDKLNFVVNHFRNLYLKTREESKDLKAENEKLKNEIEACYNQVEDFDIIATSKSNKLKKAEQKLKRIKEFATALCYTVMSDGVVILQKDILKIIDEVE